MVVVKITNPEDNKTWKYYMEERLIQQLDRNVKTALMEHDEDYVLIVDGEERYGTV